MGPENCKLKKRKKTKVLSRVSEALLTAVVEKTWEATDYWLAVPEMRKVCMWLVMESNV